MVGPVTAGVESVRSDRRLPRTTMSGLAPGAAWEAKAGEAHQNSATDTMMNGSSALLRNPSPSSGEQWLPCRIWLRVSSIAGDA